MQQSNIKHASIRCRIFTMKRRGFPFGFVGLPNNGRQSAQTILYIENLGLLGSEYMNVVRQSKHLLVLPDGIVITCYDENSNSFFI